MRSLRTLTTSCVTLLAVTACGADEEPAPPPAAAPAVAPKKAPEIDAAVKKSLDDAATEARTWVEQARVLKQKGLDLDRAKDGTGASSYTESASLFNKAIQHLATWCESTGTQYAALTTEQRTYYVNPLIAERQGWVQEVARVGILIRGK